MCLIITYVNIDLNYYLISIIGTGGAALEAKKLADKAKRINRSRLVYAGIFDNSAV